MRSIMPESGLKRPQMPAGHIKIESIDEMRTRTLSAGAGITPPERGAILAILGSVERAHLLVNRIDSERKSVNRAGVLAKVNAAASDRQQPGRSSGGLEPGIVPAE